jgi:hypothetical protein
MNALSRLTFLGRSTVLIECLGAPSVHSQLVAWRVTAGVRSPVVADASVT